MWCQLCCFKGHVLPCIWAVHLEQHGEATGNSKPICNNSTVLHRFILFLLKHVLLPHSCAKARGGYMKNTKIFPECLCFKGEEKDMDKSGMTENKYKLIPYLFANEPWEKSSAPSISWPLSLNDRTPTKIFYKNWIRGWNTILVQIATKIWHPASWKGGQGWEIKPKNSYKYYHDSFKCSDK